MGVCCMEVVLVTSGVFGVLPTNLKDRVAEAGFLQRQESTLALGCRLASIARCTAQVLFLWFPHPQYIMLTQNRFLRVLLMIWLYLSTAIYASLVTFSLHFLAPTILSITLIFYAIYSSLSPLRFLDRLSASSC